MRFLQRRTVLAAAGLIGALFALCGLAIFAWSIIVVPANATVSTSRTPLLIYSALLAASGLVTLALSGWSLLRPSSQTEIELLVEGLEPGDIALVQTLFPRSESVRLTPLRGGYSGAAVFQAWSWGLGASLQRISVVKLGSSAKLQPEIDNYERYVREYVGNTALLMNVATHGRRAALRWSYAAFSGDNVQTLADFAATGAPLAPVLDALFASDNTLGLLLRTVQRDPQRTLYRDYTWSATDWSRIVASVTPLLDQQPLQPGLPFAIPAPDARATVRHVPNPLPLVAQWFGLDDTPGERAQRVFDAPVAIVHGDLNSRNVLLDQRGAVFVIDFAHTQQGHMLRDFARLEAELTLVVDQPTDDAAVQQRVQQAMALLRDTHDQPCRTLRDLLQPRATSDQWSENVVALRRHAHDLAGPWLRESAETYLVALLHAMLDTVRYAQSGVYARRTALTLAGYICTLLVDFDERL